MGEIKNRHSVKLIIGFIYKDKLSFDRAKSVLIKKYGEIDFESNSLSFCHTDYYENEFGKNLTRSFISFKKLILPEQLVAIKILTHNIEERLSRKGRRLINIDPGYLDLAKLILASTKDFSHRIYLNKGMFAEITLVYQGKSFRPWEWTYPDYRSSEYIEIFNHIRHVYNNQIQHS